MKKEIPPAVLYTVLGVAAVVILGFAWMQFGGTGGPSADDVKRAEMQAAVGNQSLQRNTGQTSGVPTGSGQPTTIPGSFDPNSGEAAARKQSGAGY